MLAAIFVPLVLNVGATTADPNTAAALLHASEAARYAAEAAQHAAAAAQALGIPVADGPAVHGRPAADPNTGAHGNATGDPNAAGGCAKPPCRAPWLLRVALSILSVSGNANAFNGKFDGKATGQWGAWNSETTLSAAYGESTGEDEPSEVTAQNVEITERGERTFDNLLGTYVLVAAGTNRVTSIAHRFTGEAGLSMLWWEDVRAEFVRNRLRTDLGFRAIHELRYQYFPTVMRLPDALKVAYGPIAGLSFRYGISRGAYFTEEADIMRDLSDGRDIRVNSVTTLNAQFNDSLALTLAFKIAYLGVPPEGRKNTDTELSTGVAFTW